MTEDISWDVLVIGHLSRNKFWGESDHQAYREPLCTSILIRTGEQNIVVDPACGPQEMARLLDRRAGLELRDIGTVFLTHFHGDHRAGADAFPTAEVCIGANEIRIWERLLPEDGPDRELLERARPVEGALTTGIELLPTPGHTLGHVSLVLRSAGLCVVIAGDAAMTRDFFFARDWYFNTVDPEQAVQSIDAIARIADIVVPGHDNYFVARPLAARLDGPE
jgi:glyoxylase-like metal-dependent hydrolase (beta-lactamase superfamily II)